MNDRPAPSGLFLRWLASILLQFMAVIGASAQSGPSAVVVALAGIEDVEPSAEFVGRVEAENVADICVRIDSFIRTRFFDEGCLVAKGQDLFLVEKAACAIAIVSARFHLADGQATLFEAEGRLRRNLQLRLTLATSQAARWTRPGSSASASESAFSPMTPVFREPRLIDLRLSYPRCRFGLGGSVVAEQGSAAFRAARSSNVPEGVAQAADGRSAFDFASTQTYRKEGR